MSLRRDELWWIAAHVLLGLIFLAPSYIRPDSVAAFSWLRSLVVSGDLLFYDEWAGFGMIRGGITYFKEITRVGALANHWSIGSAVLTAPFYLVAHGVSRLAGWKLDGFFGLYATTLGWCSVAATVLVSVLASRLIAETDEARWRRVAAIAAVWIGTPLFWYEYRFPLGTHVFGALTVAALTAAIAHSIAHPEKPSSFWLGFFWALAVATRLQHVVLLPASLLPMVWCKSPAKWKECLRFAAGSALPIAVQAAAWLAVYGSPTGPLTHGANLQGVTYIPMQRISLVPVLVSSWHGLLTWSPIVALAIAGWILAARKGERLAVVCLLMFAGELAANSLLDRYWWGGLSFGGRRFLDLALPFALGVAALLRSCRPMTGYVLAGLSCLWSILLMGAAMAERLDLSRDVSLPGLVDAVRSFRQPLALHSPVTDLGLLGQSMIAIGIVSLLTVVILRASSRGAAAYLALCAIAILLVIPVTRRNAQSEQKRFGLDVVKSRRAGPLIDQRGLNRLELDYLKRIGDTRELALREQEIEAIDSALAD